MATTVGLAMRAKLAGVGLVVSVVATGAMGLVRPVQARQEPQVLRSRTVLVPVDVRVLDRHGTPVTGLTQDDFTIVEDGVPQTVSLFEAPAAPATDAGGRPAQRRIFLIHLYHLWLPRFDHLGYGFAGAAMQFIRDLQPGDLVAVAAFGHATDLSADHDAVARVIERLYAFQESIDRDPRRMTKVRQMYRYMGGPVPAEIAADLDAVFRIPSDSARRLPMGLNARGRGLMSDIAATMAEEYWRTTPVSRGSSIKIKSDIATKTGWFRNLFGAIQYLRHLDGEKHLIHFGRLVLPAVEHDQSLARLASDARVAIHVIGPDGGSPGYGVDLEGRMSSRHAAELTGGTASFAEWPAKALARIDEATRSGYLLGYYPSNPVLDGRHRKLTVTVTRPRGATVQYRRSYLAQDDAVPYDRRQIMVQDRIMAAGESDHALDDVTVALTAAAARGAVSLEARIDVSRVSFELVGDRRVTALEVAFFCGDRRQRIVGELWQTVDLKLQHATYQQALTDGLAHTVTLPVTGEAQHCKVVVYDYPSDRTGSAVARVR
jgi:VWFA-related protein